jgi:hypothetical protein
MAKKPEELPSIDEDLTLPTTRTEPTPPVPRPNLSGLRSTADMADETVKANSRVIAERWGATTRIPTPVQTTPLESIRVDVPAYLARELRVRCAEEKVTNAYIVMKALVKEGFHIDEKDLVVDRYKRGKK